MRFFSPLSWHHAEDLLHLFAMTKQSLLNYWSSLSRTPSGVEKRVHAKNSAPTKGNGTTCCWQKGRQWEEIRNPFPNAEPQLPFPPSNQIKITFIWDLWRLSRLHTQIADNPAAFKPISLRCFPRTLKIPLKIWTNVWMRLIPPPHCFYTLNEHGSWKNGITEIFIYPQNWMAVF